VPMLETKIDGVRKSFESKLPTLEAKIDEVKRSIDTKVPMLEQKIDALTDQIRALCEPGTPSQVYPQGSATLGLRNLRSSSSPSLLEVRGVDSSFRR
jgi:hypothetical protein